MSKVISIEEAVAKIPEGASIMIGGFLGCGSPHRLIEALANSGKGGFTIIANDAGITNENKGPLGEVQYGIAKLVHNKQVAKLIVSHVGTCPEVATQNMIDKTLEVNLLPQGSLAEMIRAAGAGLGGILTPTGVGTIIEENELCLCKQTLNGKDYLLMNPIKADIALIAGYKVDKSGNVWYKGSTSNFNIVMATAAKMVIAEAEELVECGEIPAEDVRTPGVFVKYVVEGGLY